MGILTDFIIADRSEAEAINSAEGAHMNKWPTLEGKSVDQVKLTQLWGILINAPKFDVKFLDKFTLLHEQPDEGPWLFLVPPEFVDKLLAVPVNEHPPLAQAWAKTEEFQLDRWTAEDVQSYLDEFLAFARRAKEAKKDLLFWMCV